MTILAVDDDPKTLRLLKAALSKAGHTVIAVDNARDALSVLVHTPVNLILSDVMMPDIDGNEFCRIVRAEKNLGYIPIIFLSARSSVDDLATGLVAGADDYLAKPIKLQELLDKIDEYGM